MSANKNTLRQKILDLMAGAAFMPMRKRGLAKQLELDMDEYVDFRHLIDEMVDGGEVSQLKRGKYGLPRSGGKGSTSKGKPGRRSKGAAGGGTGLVKVALLRYLKVGIFRNVRFPLHDHCRKNLGWSDTQVLVRFMILQAVLTPIVIVFFIKVR